MSAPQEALIFWQHDVAQTIPNAIWTPLLLNTNRTSRPSRLAWSDNKFRNAATTVAVGSNGQALPFATINVASTADFAASGYLAIRRGTADVVVKYTGKNATQFTGCTLGVGTLATNDAVRQGCVEYKSPFPALVLATAEVSFVGNATGRRGIRFNFNDVTFGFTGGRTLVAAGVATQVNIQTTEQPAFPLTDTPDYIEVFQDSTGSLDTVVAPTDFGASRLVAVTVSTYSGAGDNLAIA